MLAGSFRSHSNLPYQTMVLLPLFLLIAVTTILQSASSPNIAFIIADDLGVEDTDLWKSRHSYSCPKRIAERSTVFERLRRFAKFASSCGAMLSASMPFETEQSLITPMFVTTSGNFLTICEISVMKSRPSGKLLTVRTIEQDSITLIDISLENIGIVSDYLSQRGSGTSRC